MKDREITIKKTKKDAKQLIGIGEKIILKHVRNMLKIHI